MKQATTADMPLLLEMGEAFHNAAQMPFEYDRDATAISIANMMDTGCVLVTERGAIGGLIGNAWSNPKWTYACELFWWAEDGRGLELLRGFEGWAKQSGASEVRLTSLYHLERAGKILVRAGYRPLEISYGKAI